MTREAGISPREQQVRKILGRGRSRTIDTTRRRMRKEWTTTPALARVKGKPY